MKKIITTLIVLISIKIQAQEIKNYTWDEIPKFKEIPEEYKKQPAIILSDKRWIHTSGYTFARFKMQHLAVKINEQAEISKYNKVTAEGDGYIIEVRDFHARIIKPNGNVIVLPNDRIIKSDIENTQSIVFEGVEKGDILEYYYITKENPILNNTEIFQREIPVLYADFRYTSRGTDIKTFASPEFQIAEKSDHKLYFIENIPPFEKEKKSKNFNYLIKISNLISISQNLKFYLWKNYLLNNYKAYKSSGFSATKSNVKQVLKNLKLKNKTTEEKIVALCEYAKNHFDFFQENETLPKNASNLKSDNVKLTYYDFISFYAISLKKCKIPYLLIVGNDRFLTDIDPEYYNTNYPISYAFYIPETKKFIFPNESYLFYGYPMYELQSSKGIAFNVENKKVEPFTFPVAPYDFTTISSKIELNLNDDFSKIFIHKKIGNSGYYGQINRYRYNYYIKNNFDKEKTEQLIKNFCIDGFDTKLKNYTVENTEVINSYNNIPFAVNANLESVESFVEKAGNLLIVNIGKVIGKQSNLYQETERKTNIDLFLTNSQHQEIIFNIPKGYEVSSLNDLIINKEMKYDLDKNCFFKSTAKIQGNQVIITVDEGYKSITYPKELYQEYRKVVNASADFNAASIVLKSIKKK